MFKNIYSATVLFLILSGFIYAQNQPCETKKECQANKTKCEQTSDLSSTHSPCCKCEKCTLHQNEKDSCYSAKCAEHKQIAEMDTSKTCKVKNCPKVTKDKCKNDCKKNCMIKKENEESDTKE